MSTCYYCYAVVVMMALSCCALPISELTALQDLYDQTSGKSWSYANDATLVRWFSSINTSTSDPCKWAGVMCSNSKDHVIALTLAGYNLHGTLPNSMALLANLTNLNLQDNKLQGTIPNWLGDLSPALSFLDLNSNTFAKGVIPSSLARLSKLEFLLLTNTNAQGTLPASFASLSRLVVLQVGANELSGPLPSFLGRLTNLSSLEVFNNRFTSSIPTSFGDMSSLSYLNAATNKLTGVIPWQLGKTPIKTLNLGYNNLKGGSGPIPQSPPNIKAGTLWQKLQNLDTSNSAFTGPINPSVFELPQINGIVMQQSCHSGSLPESICNATSLYSLVMIGLTNNPLCAKDLGISKQVANGTVPKRLMSGTIPSCLFAFSNLGSLYLTGNGFNGTINAPVLSRSLTAIDLSYNFLEGSIPATLQLSSWLEIINLSNNKLTGTLHPSMHLPSKMLHLSINRLSGDLPMSVYTAPINYSSDPLLGLDILKGSIFQCLALNGGTEESDRYPPSQDARYLSYTCASKSLDDSIYAYITIVGAVSIVVVFLLLVVALPCLASFKAARKTAKTNLEWYYASTSFRMSSFFKRNDMDNMREFFKEIDKIRRAIRFTIIAVVVVLLPFYAAAKLVNGGIRTYTFQYGWIVTAAFMHGLVPAVFLWTFIMFCTILLANFMLTFSSSNVSASNSTALETLRWVCYEQFLCRRENVEAKQKRVKHILSSRFGQLVVHFINVCVNMVVNGAYVYGQLKGYQASYLQIIQLSIAVFGIMWSGYAIPWALELVVGSKKGILKNRLYIDIFNSVLAPAIATVMTDNACFINLFNGRLLNFDIEIKFCPTTTLCSIINYPIVNAPIPFIYNHTCSSALFRNYVPVLMYIHVLTGVVVPLSYFVLSTEVVYKRLPTSIRDLLLYRVYFEHHQRSFKKKLVASSDGSLDVVILEVDEEGAKQQQTTKGKKSKSITGSITSNGNGKSASFAGKNKNNKSFAGAAAAAVAALALADGPDSCNPKTPSANVGTFSPEDAQEEKKAQLLDAPAIFAKLLRCLFVLMTFGVASPILAMAIGVTVSVETILWRLVLGRYLLNVADAKNVFDYKRKIYCLELEEEIGECWAGSNEAFWPLVFIIFFFWSFVFFDFAADTTIYGSSQGQDIFLTVLFASGLIVTFSVLVIRYLRLRYASSLQSFFDEMQADNARRSNEDKNTQGGASAGGGTENDEEAKGEQREEESKENRVAIPVDFDLASGDVQLSPLHAFAL